MSNSPLVSYTFTEHNKSNPRKNSTYNPTGAVTKITVHHMAGNLTMAQMKSIHLNKNREMSCNYAIDSNGKIGLFVPEDRRSWCSSSRANDYLAVTVEVANDGGAPDWHVSDKALEALIELCADVCRRNGIRQLAYTGDKTGSLTMHSFFANTACPGPYLKSKFPTIAAEVNRRLNGAEPTPGGAVDWDADGNDFIVTASRGDRAELRKVCERLALPVKNA